MKSNPGGDGAKMPKPCNLIKKAKKGAGHCLYRETEGGLKDHWGPADQALVSRVEAHRNGQGLP